VSWARRWTCGRWGARCTRAPPASPIVIIIITIIITTITAITIIIIIVLLLTRAMMCSELGPAVDVWSLGCALYEGVTCQSLPTAPPLLGQVVKTK
jgi:serine/threonine protein kinase